MPLRDGEIEALTARDRAELAWWREFALKFRGPLNLPRPGDPLTHREYRLQGKAADGFWRDDDRGPAAAGGHAGGGRPACGRRLPGGRPTGRQPHPCHQHRTAWPTPAGPTVK